MTASMLLLVFTLVEAPNAGWGSLRTLGSLGWVCCDPGRLRGPRAQRRRAARPARHPALAVARPGEPRCDVALRRLGRLPVHRHALPAAAAWLVAARDRARDLPRRRPRRDPLAADRAADRPLRRHAPDRRRARRRSPPATRSSSRSGSTRRTPSRCCRPSCSRASASRSPSGRSTSRPRPASSPEEQGLAGGLLNTSFQFGGALALAIVTAVINANVGAGAIAAEPSSTASTRRSSSPSARRCSA